MSSMAECGGVIAGFPMIWLVTYFDNWAAYTTAMSVLATSCHGHPEPAATTNTQQFGCSLGCSSASRKREFEAGVNLGARESSLRLD